MTRFRAAIRLFNRTYAKRRYGKSIITKAEARRLVRITYPDFV